MSGNEHDSLTERVHNTQQAHVIEVSLTTSLVKVSELHKLLSESVCPEAEVLLPPLKQS